MISREEIYSALYGLLSGAAVFQTASRRLRVWDDVSPAEQPALFMVQREEDVVSTSPSLPSKCVMYVDVYIYVRETDPVQAPASVINPLVDSVQAVLAPVFGVQDLGGLVTSCQIDGKIEYDEGVLGDQAVVVIPVRVIVAGS